MEPRGNTVLVTGASGFVGGHVARRLAETEGMRVRALVRSPGGKTVVSLNHPCIELVRGDLLDPTSLAAASVGVKLVFHAATDTAMKDRAVAWATAVDGTRSLYEAARTAGVQRFIFMSTFDVYFDAMHCFDNEETPLLPYGDLYGDSKITAEGVLLAAPVEGPVVIILRPPAIYGPGSRDWTIQMIEDAKKGRLFLPGGGKFPFPYVYIDNLVDAVVAAARADAPCGVYNVMDGRTTYSDFVRPFARLAGRDPISLPFWVLWLATMVAEIYSRLMGKWVPISPARTRVMTARNRERYATADRARHDLGWVPRVEFGEGMRRTQIWLRKNGYLG